MTIKKCINMEVRLDVRFVRECTLTSIWERWLLILLPRSLMFLRCNVGLDIDEEDGIISSHIVKGDDGGV
jgi:hypothetical protein